MRIAVHHNKRIVRGDVTLAMLVYWNALYSTFVFLVVAWVYVLDRLINSTEYTLSSLEQAWYGGLVVIWTVCEPARLYSGTRGNNTASVSLLVGFFLLTLIEFMPLIVIYNFVIPYRNSLDYSMSIVELIFGSLELLAALRVLRRLVRRNTIEFFVHLGSVAPPDGEAATLHGGDVEMTARRGDRDPLIHSN